MAALSFSLFLGTDYGKTMLTVCMEDLALGVEGGEHDDKCKIPVTVGPDDYEAGGNGGGGRSAKGKAAARRGGRAGSPSSSVSEQDDLDTFGREEEKSGMKTDQASRIQRRPYPLFAYIKDYINMTATKDKGCGCAGDCATNPTCQCRLRNKDNQCPYKDGLLRQMHVSQ